MLRLNKTDPRFLVETVATKRRDYEHIADLVRDKEDLLESILEDPKLLNRLLEEEEGLIRVSPYFLFSVLLRQVRRDLGKHGYILEIDSKGKRIPVFEAPGVVELLANKHLLNYLAEMLSSFAHTNSGVVYWKEHGTWHKQRFSDIDIDDLIQLARIIDSEMRPALYKRIADVALFLSGVFPDHLTVFASRHQNVFAAKRTLKEYEQEGKRFFWLAGQELDDARWQPALQLLAEKFTIARWALNTLSDRYLQTRRELYFRSTSN
jgi:hypothetical protein